MNRMFCDCSKLTELNLSNFNTSNVTNMSNMFRACSSLTSLDLSSFNTSKVTDMEGMFSNCYKFTTLDLSHFDTSNVTSMFNMFMDCKVIQTQINIKNANMTNYANIFSRAATGTNSYIIIGYTSATQTLAETIKSNYSSNTRITLQQI